MLYGIASATERRTMPPAVAVSTVAFSLRPPRDAVLGAPDAEGAPRPAASRRAALWVPLVRRTREPYLGCWALPGGPTEWHETLADTALRTVREAAWGTPGYLEQLFAFGGVERSAEAQRLVTIAYWALYGERDLRDEPPAREPGSRGAEPRPGGEADPVPAAGAPEVPPRSGSGRWDDPEPAAATFATAPADPPPAIDQAAPGAPAADPNVAWFAVDELPPLAFDHAEIIEYALARLRAKTEYAAVAHRFLGPVFTLAQLRAVHEAVRGCPVDAANFRRQMLAQGNLVDTGERETGTRHRPARLYRFADDTDTDPGAAADASAQPGTDGADHDTDTGSKP